MNLNKFNDDDVKPFHSSGYAEAAHGSNIGATSSQSFSHRAHIDRNRQSVHKYQHSFLAHGHRRDTHYQRIDIINSPARPEPEKPVVRHDIKPASRFGNRGMAPPSTSGFSRSAQRPGFSEPSTRGYNPYQ